MSDSTLRPWLDLRQTHCAGLLLAGDQVVKFKKPVDLGFLDFTSLEAREDACRREVQLNRRFAPDVYLGLGHLVLPDGNREPVVVMRRMPDHRRLAHLVAVGADVTEDLRAIARRLAVVHAGCERREAIDREASLGRLRGRWEQSFAQVRKLPRGVGSLQLLDEVEGRARQFLDGRRPLFDARVAEGCAVDGHGDLLTDDIFCLADGPRVLDCLEFDDALRYVDRIDDVCFLAMDLEHLGAAELGAAFVGWYAEYAGDTAPPSLVHHYIAYRAFVRAKVACLRAEQSTETTDEVAAYLAVTQRHLMAGTVTLTLVGGPPGSGKTTVATGLADRLDSVVLSTDRVRKEVEGLDPTASAAAPYGEGIYDAEHTRRTYAELLHRAELLLGRGESVILDATWTGADLRQQARAVAQGTQSELVELRCVLDPAEAALRIGARRTETGRLSDAEESVAGSLREAAQPWPEARACDTKGSVEEVLCRATHLVQPLGSRPLLPVRRRPVLAPD